MDSKIGIEFIKLDMLVSSKIVDFRIGIEILIDDEIIMSFLV